MKCWICGDEASSREHLIKASDLRLLFGIVTQKKPLYFHTDVQRNKSIGGIKSDKLKFASQICARCNNERTQPHDQAWERLSGYLLTRQPPIRGGAVVRLDRAFPGSVRESMRYVHLFFLKLFGCLIVEHKVPLDINPFADAILHNTFHPKVRLTFGTGLQHPTTTHAGYTPIQTAATGGTIVFATWFYILDRISVNIMYSEPMENRKGLFDSWHPSTIGKRLRIIQH